MQIAMDFLIPVILLLVHEAVAGQRRPVFVGAMLGLVVAVQLVLGEEILFMTGLAATIALIMAALNAPSSIHARLPRLAGVGAVALLVFLVLDAYPLW